MPVLRLLDARNVTSRAAPFSTKEMVPRVGSMKPAIMRRSVVLPQPEGPSRKKSSPASMSRDTAFTAVVSSPVGEGKDLVIPLIPMDVREAVAATAGCVGAVRDIGLRM